MNTSVLPQAEADCSPLPGGQLADMQAAPIWLLWKEVFRDGKAKPAKVPYYADGAVRRGTYEALDDRARLVPYDEAFRLLADNPKAYAGLGFVLGPDGRGGCWQGIDFDDVQQNGLAEVANAVPGYVEFSPSGEGAHAVGYGESFATLGPNGTGLEAYAGGRFFTFTGQKIRDTGQVCLASFVEQSVRPRHQARRSDTFTPGIVTVDAATIKDLRSALLSMRADDYDIWYRMGLALKELGDAGRGLWLEWSATSEKFDPLAASRAWDHYKPHSTGYGAVFAEAMRRGWVNPQAVGDPRHGASVAEDLISNLQTDKGAALTSSSARLSLLRDDDLDALPPLRWMVKGVIPDAGIGAIYGASGTYKSFLSVDLLAHVSNGKEWFGHRVKAAPAVYVPFEGQAGVPKRIRAWRQMQSAERHPERVGTFEPDEDVLSNVAVVMEPINLLDPNDRDRLVATLTKEGLAGGLLEIDTLAQAASGIEENSSEMGKMLTIFRELQQRLGGVILLVHHSGKDESRGMRGWSGLHAAMDFVIECRSRGEPGARLAEFSLTKVKDDATGATHPFRLDMVPLGPDEDGDPVTSLVVRPVEPDQQSEHPFKQDKPDKAGTDADTAGKDDDFIDAWTRSQVLANKYPSKNGLKSQLGEMKDTGYEITQVRVLAAIDRLLDSCRLVREPKSPNGNPWLRPQDVDVGGSPA